MISTDQNIKIDSFETELEYMRSQLDRDFTAKISLVDRYIREKIDVNIPNTKRKKKATLKVSSSDSDQTNDSNQH